MLNFCNDVQNDSELYREYQEKYNSFLVWYKDAYKNNYNLCLKNIEERSDEGSIPEAHRTTGSYNTTIEVLLKLILSKYSKCCDDQFCHTYGINVSCSNEVKGSTWLECKFDVPVLIELLAKVFENRKIKPKFDLKNSGDNRYTRNGVEHQGDNKILLSSIRTYNNIREMFIFLDEDVSEELPVFQMPQLFDFQNFVSDCGGLKLDDFTSILLVDSVHDISEQKREVVANLKWDYVIDFDGYSPIKSVTLYGDVSESGQVEQYDYDLLNQYINGETSLNQRQKLCADINNDGEINKTDLLLLEGVINGYINLDMINPLTNYTLYGDVDCNGKIQSIDASVLRQYLIGKRTLDNQQLKNADVNADGVIDETDAKLIQEYVVQMHENTLPFKPIK